MNKDGKKNHITQTTMTLKISFDSLMSSLHLHIHLFIITFFNFNFSILTNTYLLGIKNVFEPFLNKKK